MAEGVIECGINFLSYERALTFVPPEFKIGFEWYQAREGEIFSHLPHRNRSLVLPNEIKICADRGIHAPDYGNLASKGAGKQRYALAVHAQCKTTSNHDAYANRDVIMRGDGTWIFDYCGHRPNPGRRETDAGNRSLRNNLIDGVPVAVLIQQNDGSYLNKGLAYVERYDPLINVFTLHGPVSAELKNKDFASIVPMEELSVKEREAFMGADEGDRRKRVVAEQIRREKQAQFRKALLSAYRGLCAVTGVDVPEVLQAAHIDPYRGSQSQHVTNGILLRSDIHLLYDSHLLTIMPETNEIRASESLQNTYYGELHGERISVPTDPQCRPDDALLDRHVREFEAIEHYVA